MPQLVPQTTGNDLLAYKGDAALAAGANNGITPQPTDPFAGIGNTIDQVNERNAQMRLLEYKQKIKRQDDLAAMLANTGGSVFNMKNEHGQNMSYDILPQDKKEVHDAVDDWRRDVVSNPNTARFDPRILAKYDKINDLISHAGRRSVAYANYDLEAAKETDPDEQKSIKAMQRSEINNHKLSEFYIPEPHLAGIPPGSPKDFVAKEAMDKKNWQLVSDDGKTERYVVPQQYITDPRKLRSGDPLYKTAMNWAKKSLNTPVSVQDAMDVNNGITAYNTDRKLNPGNVDYMPPLYSIDPNNGQVSFVEKDPEKNLLDITAAHTFGRYGRGMNVDKSAEDIEKINKTKSEEDHQKVAEQQKQQEINETKRYHDQLAAKEDKTTAETIKDNADKRSGLAMNGEVNKVFDKSNYKELLPSSPITTIIGNNLGYNPKEYDYYKVPSSVNANKYIGIEAGENPVTTTTTIPASAENIATKEASTTKNAKGEPLRADATIMVRNKKTDEAHFVYIKDGAVVSDVTKRQAKANGVKAEYRFDDKLYANKVTYAQYAHDQEEGGAPASAPVASKPKVIKAGQEKQIGTITYVQDANGDWHKK